MITREDIRQLAELEAAESAAVSFYFQPATPQDKSHRAEAILIKDLVRAAEQHAAEAGRNGALRQDLGRILAMAEVLRHARPRAKAVFACAAQGFWREFDLPARLPGSGVFVGERFHLKPLAAVLDALPRTCIALVDRERARLFELQGDVLSEQESFASELPRRGRSDGFAGYDAGHAERHVEQEAQRHLKATAERLQERLAAGGFERLIVGCRDETWPLLEAELHAYLKQRLAGRFPIDPATATAGEVRQSAERLLRELEEKRRSALIQEALGQAHRDGRGRAGLRPVLLSLETGEAQALLISSSFAAPAAQCRHCGHLDTRMTAECAVCGKATRELADVSDAMLARAFGGGVDIVWVESDERLEKAGGVAALLRFRADQNTAEKKAG
jgi:peptide subunit release factor 1 (eRF1)